MDAFRFYFILYVVTAIITPDGRLLADIALFIPMAMLWEVALLNAKRYEKEPSTSPSVSSFDMSKKCSYCGQTQDDSDVFCKQC
jgi:Sec-independent protein secretion pathway component TatC